MCVFVCEGSWCVGGDDYYPVGAALHSNVSQYNTRVTASFWSGDPPLRGAANQLIERPHRNINECIE